MTAPYRALLVRPGAKWLALGCALGWLSFSSYALAIVLAVEGATGSFAIAGAAVAAFAAASAAFAPLRGRSSIAVGHARCWSSRRSTPSRSRW